MIAFSPLAHHQAGPLVKICGLRSADHALVASSGGAALLGLVFAPSKRRIMPDEAAALATELRQHGHSAGLVGVFVNESPQTMNALAERCSLAALQLSGDEPPEILPLLQRPVIVALRLRDDERERGWIALSQRHPERVLLLVDAHVAGSYGGSGAVADWSRAAALARQQPLLLAGGLTPENVADALLAVRPLGVDVSSGVETAGVKDTQKINAFLHAVWHAGGRMSSDVYKEDI